jgi:hypothetical protein
MRRALVSQWFPHVACLPYFLIFGHVLSYLSRSDRGRALVSKWFPIIKELEILLYWLETGRRGNGKTSHHQTFGTLRNGEILFYNVQLDHV